MSKKTIPVVRIKEMVNKRLAYPTRNDTPEVRIALASLLETILHETDNYHGYNYLDWLNGGSDAWRKDGEPRDNTKYLGDQSKRVYY